MVVGDLERKIELRRIKMLSQLIRIYPVEVEEAAKGKRVAIRGVSVGNSNIYFTFLVC
jgi:hypothetical protein